MSDNPPERMFVVPATPAEQLEADVTKLCDLLADYLEARDGRRPTSTTMRWTRDMRLLLQRGPTGVERHPEEAAVVEAVIRATFECETWWSETISDPGFLRKHYLRIGRAAGEASRKHQKSAAVGDMMERLKAL